MSAVSYWNSTAGATKTAEVEKLLLYISFGMFSLDTILNASFDWSIISGKRQRRWPQLFYFAAKLALTIYFALYIAVLWLEVKANCQGIIIAFETSMGFIAIFSSGLLACRTVCVYFGTARKVVTVVLLVFGAGLVAAWMYGVQDVTAEWLVASASPWNTGACTPVAIKPTYYVKYLLTIIFDLVVLVLTTVGIIRMEASSRIGDVIIKQGVIYFLLTLTVNVVITVLTILKLSPTMSLLAAAPQSMVCVVATTRLYRQLAEEAAPKSHISSFNSSGSGRFIKSSGSSDHTLPSQSTEKFGSSNKSIDRMEKGNLSHNSIRIEQRETVDVSIAPEYLKGHPFSNTTLLNYEGDGKDSPTSPARMSLTQSRYPRLIGQSSPERIPE